MAGVRLAQLDFLQLNTKRSAKVQKLPNICFCHFYEKIKKSVKKKEKNILILLPLEYFYRKKVLNLNVHLANSEQFSLRVFLFFYQLLSFLLSICVTFQLFWHIFLLSLTSIYLTNFYSELLKEREQNAPFKPKVCATQAPLLQLPFCCVSESKSNSY